MKTRQDCIPLWNLDQEFLAAKNYIRGRSLVMGVKAYILWQLAKSISSLEGDIAEVGVYKGGTAYLLARAVSPKIVHLLDTFTGIPKVGEQDIHREGDFNDTSVEEVEKFLIDCDNVRLYPGYFPATAIHIDGKTFSMAHVDVDTYQSTLDCCSFFYPRMVPGGIIVCDDYGFKSCPGAKLAMDQYFEHKPESIIYLPTGQSYIYKRGRSDG